MEYKEWCFNGLNPVEAITKPVAVLMSIEVNERILVKDTAQWSVNINVIIIYTCHSDAKGFPLEDWINPSLHRNSSTPNSQKPLSSFQKLLQQASHLRSRRVPSASVMLLLGLLPIPRAAHPGAPSLSPKPRPLTDSRGEPRLCCFLFPEFLTADWVQDAKGPNMRHTTYRQPFPPPCPSFCVTAHSGNLHLHLYSCSEHLPQETSQEISYPWIGCSTEMSSGNRSVRCLLTFTPKAWEGGYNTRVLQHLCFQLTRTPLRSSQGFQQGLLRIAPSPWIRGEAWSPLPMTPLVFRWGFFCVSQGPS